MIKGITVKSLILFAFVVSYSVQAVSEDLETQMEKLEDRIEQLDDQIEELTEESGPNGDQVLSLQTERKTLQKQYWALLNQSVGAESPSNVLENPVDDGVSKNSADENIAPAAQANAYNEKISGEISKRLESISNEQVRKIVQDNM